MKYLPLYCLGSAMSLAVMLFLGSGCAQQQPQQTSFDSPDQAADSLVQAIREWSPDRFKQIFGAEANDILDSGDQIADHQAGEKFLKAYDERHHWTVDGDSRFTLVVGNQDWPMPVPIVKNEKDRWYFDGPAGKDEIINRRIGRNELDVIQVTQAIVDAQRDYLASNPTGGSVPEYARKFLSDSGKKNGLYWPTAEGEAQSPLGELVAGAVEEGYSATAGSEPRPYHGYCYRILTSQGDDAPGGAKNYVVNGKFTGGFAVIAYPADYGSSGIMTFIINNQGVLYQKDLGLDTSETAKETVSFDPGSGWLPIAADVASTAVSATP